ncbi:MAG: response regulator [Gemmatimonadaceae bacterium]|nr:response regulator [Chitinophagaceae bacterium]
MPIDRTPTRILIVDDDEDDFFITSEYLKSIEGNKFVIEWSHKYSDGLAKMMERKYDVYFVDYRLGAKTGLDLLKEAIANHCEEPIILLTGKGNHEIDIQAMQAGAVDYLVKPELNTEKLERCIRYALERSAGIKALKANERKFRNIFEKSKDSVFVTDSNLRFREVNPATANILGYSVNELLNMTLYDLLANPSDKVWIQKQLSVVGSLNDKEMELITANDDKKSCVVAVSFETNPDGTHYAQGLIHDITNLKKAEKTTLQAEKLRAAGRLVRTLAHEVRNPLNNINLSVEQLSPEITEDTGRLYLDIINRNSKRIGDLISELLDTSRPAEIVLQKTSLQAILDESIAASLDRITLKRIKLSVTYPDDAAYIMADMGKLKIAFLNIIINAIEAMEEEKGQLSISLVSEKSQHIISIADNGTGISEENLSRLFEPYFTSKRNGLGLGLAATLNIIQSHKGSIDVISTINQGTNFLIRFEPI